LRRRELYAAPEAPDLRDEKWVQFVDDVDAMIVSEDYTWAAETLKRIHAAVTQQQYVTETQFYTVGRIRVAEYVRRRGYWW
jgi:hypothetical protein